MPSASPAPMPLPVPEAIRAAVVIADVILKTIKSIDLPIIDKSGSPTGEPLLFQRCNLSIMCLLYEKVTILCSRMVTLGNYIFYSTIKVQLPGATSILPAGTVTPVSSGSSSFSPKTSSLPFRHMVRLRMPVLPVRA